MISLGYIETIERFDASRKWVSRYQEVGYDEDTIPLNLIFDENALVPEECGIRAAMIQQVRQAWIYRNGALLFASGWNRKTLLWCDGQNRNDMVIKVEAKQEMQVF